MWMTSQDVYIIGQLWHVYYKDFEGTMMIGGAIVYDIHEKERFEIYI